MNCGVGRRDRMRLIDADALTASLKESADRCRDWIQECTNIKDDVTQRVAEQSLLTFTECYLRIEKMPTIEPQRMRGKWIVHYECPKCGELTKDFTEHCQFCGADMRGQND